MKSNNLFIFLCLLLFIVPLSCDSEELPLFGTRIDPSIPLYDSAAILTRKEFDSLNKIIFNNNLRGSSRITVFIIKELPTDVSIEGYANELFNSFGVEKKEISKHVLFLVAIKNRKLRIQVSKDLNSVLTSEYRKNIIKESNVMCKDVMGIVAEYI